MSTIKLYNYQINIIQAIHQAWAGGARNVLLQLATGGGKTIIFCDIIKNFNEHQIAIAHRQELISQLSLTLAKSGIYHDLLAAKSVIRNVVRLHLLETGHSYYRPGDKRMVAGIDTLIRMQDPRFTRVKQVIQDEAHHVLKGNKWGEAARMFPNARGLYPTATPLRADGRGLGVSSDGLIDSMILGPLESDLIAAGYLSNYKIYAPLSDIDVSKINITSSGDYSPQKLREAVKKSHIVGDVVSHYLKFAAGKSGITFVASIDCAEETAAAYRSAGVPAEIITGKTPDLLRANLIQRYKNREVLQLVNVDLLGEGVDIPLIEVVSLARPTQSLAVHRQQIGRALRLSPGKTHAIIIDHVNNCIMHGLPDTPYSWSLERRSKKSNTLKSGAIPLKTCGNPACLGVYERTHKVCPYCGFYTAPGDRGSPEAVDGDLTELTQDVLDSLRRTIAQTDGPPRIPMYLDGIAQRAIVNRHITKQGIQKELRESIALWAGFQRDKNLNDSQIYRKFYFLFGTDILTAQTLNVKDGELLLTNIKNKLTSNNIISTV